ncbi:MAG: hypothetical protein J6U08_02805 [Paludibacteraceae bacterium]|nr:hypothetical protein [Paludibacteraceae bacterium]
MIATPPIINGEHLNFKQTWEVIRMVPYYQSKKTWIIKTAYTYGLILAIGGIICMAALIATKLTNPNWESSWPVTILGGFFCPAMWLYPFALIATYFQSFIYAKKLMRIHEDFMRRWFKDNKIVVPTTPLNCIVKIDNGWDLEVAVTTDKYMRNQEKPLEFKSRKFIVVALYIESPTDPSLIESEWEAFCQGKASCRNLFFKKDLAYIIFPANKPEEENLPESLQQMEYLIQRFQLTPHTILRIRTAEEDSNEEKNSPNTGDDATGSVSSEEHTDNILTNK